MQRVCCEGKDHAAYIARKQGEATTGIDGDVCGGGSSVPDMHDISSIDSGIVHWVCGAPCAAVVRFGAVACAESSYRYS